MTTETRNLVLDNDMIFKLIFAQAGSFAKAVLEAVQNAIDAKATSVSIILDEDGKGYTITDDGVGFKSRKEVEEWFEVVGFNHNIPEKKESKFSVFGLVIRQEKCLYGF